MLASKLWASTIRLAVAPVGFALLWLVVYRSPQSGSIAAAATAKGTAPDQEAAAAEVLNQNSQSLRQIPAVFIVAISLDPGPNLRILVMVEKVTPELKSKIPQIVGAVPVKFSEPCGTDR